MISVSTNPNISTDPQRPRARTFWAKSFPMASSVDRIWGFPKMWGTPKWMVYNGTSNDLEGKSYWNGWFEDTPIHIPIPGLSLSSRAAVSIPTVSLPMRPLGFGGMAWGKKGTKNSETNDSSVKSHDTSIVRPVTYAYVYIYVYNISLYKLYIINIISYPYILTCAITRATDSQPEVSLAHPMVAAALCPQLAAEQWGVSVNHWRYGNPTVKPMDFHLNLYFLIY